MSETIRVAPVEGRTMVLESNPRVRIDAERDVPNTAYYRRAIERGDLQRVEAAAPSKPLRAGKES